MLKVAAQHEINLLPPSRRRLIRAQFIEDGLVRFWRRVAVSLGLLSVVGISAWGTFMGLARLSDNTAEAALQKKVAEHQAVRDSIAETNKALSEMAQVLEERIIWSELIPDVLQALPPGTRLIQVRGEKKVHEMALIGQALSRGSILALEERLRGLAWVAAIESPPENLLDRVNPSFSFSVHIKEADAAQ